MTTMAHPFVVARNRTLDWRPLLAPDPLIEGGEDYALVLETAAQHPAPVTVRTWQDGTGAAWVLVFRSVAASPAFVGQNGSEQLTDRFGRDLYLVEGVAVRDGETSMSPGRALELVERVHTEAVPVFRDFWTSDDESVSAVASEPFDLDETTRPSAPDRRVAAAPGARSSPVLVVLTAVLVVALVVVVVLMFGPGTEPVRP